MSHASLTADGGDATLEEPPGEVLITSELQQQLREVYNISHWSNGYFDISNKGTIQAFPDKKRRDATIDMAELLETIYQSGLTTPVLIRFTDILKQRFRDL